jgi:hypothetical protein
MYLDNGQIISDSVSFAILMPLKLFDFSNISPDDNVMVEIFVFGSLFGIGLLGTVGMMNAGQISNRFKKLLKKKDQEINE